MGFMSRRPAGLLLLAAIALPASASLSAQSPQQDPADRNIFVDGVRPPQPAAMTVGPEIKGVITARSGDRIKVTTAEGATTIVTISDTTQIRATAGLFGSASGRLGASALLNGLPVTVRTLQSGDGLVASRIVFRNSDLKTANMIRNGTAQRFDEQTAATEALRGRMADIDQYNVKQTTNAYFATGRAALSPEAKADLCSTAAAAEAMDNALILVVGYTDSTGSQEYNQQLSEKRAASVINYLQQACRWKPYRMLTPTGMAEADPLAPNDTIDGKARNRRVSVNVLVSKGLDGL
jgi:OmpA-OmpF porin, OOP family